MTLRVGIDIGGTFTDIVMLAAGGGVSTVKVLSTPDDYSRGIVQGLSGLLADGNVAPDGIAQIMHGTTVATNALLEGKGARVALITTDGFRDVLEIRRLRMPALYDIRFRKPPALVPRRLRYEVPERIDASGKVERPLDEAEAERVVEAALASGVDTIAVCLLNAYANGAHEERLLELIRERDAEIPVSLSSRINPEIKEYERTSTTVVNAYVLPSVKAYLGRLGSELAGREIRTPVRIMQSNGGVMRSEAAAERPFNIIESGPAAGVVGAAEIARQLGGESLLAFDMGGTTAKAALIEKGEFLRVGSLDVGGGINMSGRLLKGGGYHVSAPAIDIAEVGAGGGSLVGLDAGGGLTVGPESAGSSPGPVCYEQGGGVPTVTDANVVLGFINPESLAGGSFPIRHELAHAAITEQVAKPLGLSVEEAAWGIHRVADAKMARALRAVSTERGLDPRSFAIMAFGGNGPVHAATLASLLSIRRILVPPIAGVFSSLGMLFPEVEHHFTQTLKRLLENLDGEALRGELDRLVAEGREALAREGIGPAMMVFEPAIDLRYAGANTELTVALDIAKASAADLRLQFEDAHERQYGYRSPEERVETVNLRLVARGRAQTKSVPDAIRLKAGSGRRPGTRAVYFGPAGQVQTPIVARGDLRHDSWTAGPLLVEEYDSTTVVPPGGRARLIAWDTIEIELA
ncbi:hydantoinase/oxoprolinase family protein [Enterovirga sp. CN4-39]|uniref:hydantoinase/oxoprolinase family protein n=1 Tax=Enterovirga sp. CN4-39 TaxID=3400910 RepID=UPI003C02A576